LKIGTTGKGNYYELNRKGLKKGSKGLNIYIMGDPVSKSGKF